MVSSTLTSTQNNTGMPAIDAAGLRNPSKAFNPPGVSQGLSYSVHTMHQPGIFEDVSTPEGQKILPWGWGVQRSLPKFSREEIKEKLAGALDKLGEDIDALKVRACQKEYSVVTCSKCGLPVAYAYHCRNRLCPSCAAAAAELLISEHAEVLKQIRYPKMVTLTWLPVKHLTREIFKKARRDINKLRHNKVWGTVFGGIGSFEVTYSEKHGWHLHWHCVVGSGYIPQDELSKAWKKITGAPIVDIRAIKNKDKWAGIREVVKYPAKSVDFLDNPELVKEFLEATKGLKLVTGFGSLFRVRVKKHCENKLVCPRCGSLEFDWENKITVTRERVKPYGSGFVLNEWSRAGPESGERKNE